MPQEEQRCSNSSGRGGGTRSSSKMPKEKRPPKRGLGVAKLELMLYWERQKKAVAAPPSCFVHPPIPFPLSSPSHLPPTTSILNPFIPISSVGFLTPPPSSFSFQDSQAGDASWNSMAFNHDAAEEEGRKFEHSFPFCLHNNNSNSIWSPPGAVVNKQDKQHQPPTSMVNIPTLPYSPSGVNPPMEPPSNQIFYINSTRLWPEEKVVGRKRPYPFSLEDFPLGVCGAPFRCKLPPFSPSCHSWEEFFCGQDASKSKSCNATVREEGPSGSKTTHADNDLNFVKAIKENGSLGRGFLTLGLPATSSNPKSKRLSAVPSTHLSEFNLLPFQESMELQPEVPTQSQPFYSFLPMVPNSHLSATCEGRDVGADSVVDLNLKL